jgi:flagellin
MNSFRIHTNVNALNAYYSLDKVNRASVKAQLRIASGKRILHVADDTSGFNIGNSLNRRVSVMQSAHFNVTSAKDLMNTAESGLLGVQDLLTSIKGKLADATNPTSDRSAIAEDIKALAQEIQATLNQTKFNNTNLLTAETSSQRGIPTDTFAFNFQISGELSDTMQLDYASTLVSGSAAAGGSGNSFTQALDAYLAINEDSITNSTSLSSMGSYLDDLVDDIEDSLGDIGNLVQRLDIKEETLNVAIANAKSSYSRLFDADMAMEQLNATRNQIVGQASTAMLAQLNINPSDVLQLFG